MPELQEPAPARAPDRAAPRELLDLARTLADALERVAPEARGAGNLVLARSLARHVVELLESAAER